MKLMFEAPGSSTIQSSDLSAEGDEHRLWQIGLPQNE
jgi:hypothetical protein